MAIRFDDIDGFNQLATTEWGDWGPELEVTQEMINAFAELTRAQAGALFDRLDINYTRDDLARKFHKLTDVRRDRLMTFLARVAECA